jgi:hypothetical protein
MTAASRYTASAGAAPAASGPATYNYAIFPPVGGGDRFGDFAEHLKVGAEAPDGELALLGPDQETERVRLSGYWRDGDLVVEFGSVT